MKKNSRREVAASRIVKTNTEVLILNNIGIQRGDPKEDDNGVTTGTSTPNSDPSATLTNEKLVGVPPVTSRLGPAASPVLPSYPVGRGISLPLGQSLRKCEECSCTALIAWSPQARKVFHFVCLDHGLEEGSATQDLVLPTRNIYRHYSFISPEHKAAIQTFLRHGS
jgi:hypothetical protein